MRYKFRWAEADLAPKDEKLDTVEFRMFRHPESSDVTIARLVNDILENLGKGARRYCPFVVQ